MNEELLYELTLKELSGEASPEERAQLQSLIRTDSTLATAYEELSLNLALVQTFPPLSPADAQATQPTLPPYRLAELHHARRRHFPATPPKVARPSFWTQLFSLPKPAYAFALSACLLIGLFSLNHRSGIEFGAYTETEMRDGLGSELQLPHPTRRFERDEPFQSWQNSRFGPRYRIWFDEAESLIIVVESGGLFSPNKTRTWPLPESNQERSAQLQSIIQELSRP
ncbi:MAG: hypothetical protein HC904_05285 [Blastochloris sp.]|nr:hypothetical protein [Blastochloris sp.]